MTRRISGFLIKGRYVTLILMLVIAVFCAVFSRKVNVVSDRTAILPDDSMVKKGIRVFEEEFGEPPAENMIRLMGKGLSEDDKQAIRKELGRLDHVKSVTCEYDSEDYKKGKYSLFLVNAECAFSTREMESLENMIKTHICPRYDLVYDTNDSNADSDLPIFVLAAICLLLLVILWFLCESRLEPFFLLFTVGIAIVINMGTNVYLGGVLRAAGLIAPIFQLILSVESSLLLVCHYHQERSKGKKDITAMTDAIGSSSIWILGNSFVMTAGLLFLVFWNLRVGADLGILLIKGVWINTLCIYTVLPALLLLSSSIFSRNTPKSSHGNRSKRVVVYAGSKIVFSALLLCLAAVGILVKADQKLRPVPSSEISDIFPWESTIVVLYGSDEEEKIKTVAAKLEKEISEGDVETYATTLGIEYSAEEMREKLEKNMTDMSENMNRKPWLLQLIYFEQGGYGIQPLPLGEFLSFLDELAEEAPELLEGLDSNWKKKLAMLAILADEKELAKARTAEETASLLGIDKTLAEKLFQVSGKERMGLMEFLQAAENYSGAASSVSPELMKQIEMASLFTDPEEYTKDRTAAELAQIFGVEESTLSSLLRLKGRKTASIEGLIGMVSSSSLIMSMLPSDITGKLYLVAILTDPREMAQKRTAEEISGLLGIDRSLLSIMGDESMSIAELMEMAENLSALPDLTSLVSGENLVRIRQIMTDTENNRAYTPAEMAKQLEGMSVKIDEARMELIYRIYGSRDIPDTDRMSLEQLFARINEMSESAEYAEVFDEKQKSAAAKAARKLADEKRLFVGKKYSVMRITTSLPEASEETDELLETIEKRLKNSLNRKYYLVGNAPLQRELAEVFSEESRKTGIVMGAVLLLSGVLLALNRRVCGIRSGRVGQQTKSSC